MLPSSGLFLLQEEDIFHASEAQIHEQVSAWTKRGLFNKHILTEVQNVCLKDGEAHQQAPQLAPAEADEVQPRQPPRPGRERELHRPLQPIEDTPVSGTLECLMGLDPDLLKFD